MIKLGDEVRCSLTGFTGTAVSRSEWLFGCVRIGVQPPMKDGAFVADIAFDEAQLIRTRSGHADHIDVLRGAGEEVAAPGGARPDAKQSARPSR